jgi:hypothetical protein
MARSQEVLPLTNKSVVENELTRLFHSHGGGRKGGEKDQNFGPFDILLGIGVFLNDEDTSIHSTPEPKRLLLVAYVDYGLVAYHALRYGWSDCQQSPAQANI